MSRDIVWADSETTALSPSRRIWEFAAIKGTEERVWVVTDVDVLGASEDSLRIGGYYDRHPKVTGNFLSGVRYGTEQEVAEAVWEFLNGCTIYAAIPEFDLVPLAGMMRRHHLTPPWHYRARCIESYVVGHLAGDPGGLQDCARALGLDPADYAAHSALGDAQMVRDCWLLIHMGIDAEFDRPVRDVLAQAKRQILRESDDDPAEVRAAFDRGPRDVTTMPDRTLRTR